MADENLSKLTIDKNPGTTVRTVNKHPAVTIILVAAVFLIGFLLIRNFIRPAVSVEASAVSLVYPSQAFTLLNASGYVVAQRKAAVASKVTGRLVSIYVEEGNRARKGDIIALLESNDVLAAIERAGAGLRVSKANLDLTMAELADAESNLRRSGELLDKGFISKVDYDTSEVRQKKAEAAVSSAKAAMAAQAAALREAEVLLEYTRIRSPFDGVVLTKNADIGDIVTPLGAAANAKAAVITIADMDSLQTEVDVSESNIGQVKLKQPCEIQLDAFPETRFRGEVHMIVPTADRTKATVLVKIKFLDRDQRILPEMSARVAFLERRMEDTELKPRIAVSPNSVITRNNKTLLFVIRDGRAVETPIAVGAKIGDMVEITSGVNTGERIVRNPSDKISNNVKVTISGK